MKRYTVMMTQSMGIQADRGRRFREPGRGNKPSGSELALSHEQTKSKAGREKGRNREHKQRSSDNS